MRIASKLLLSYVGIASLVAATAIIAYSVTSLIASSYSRVSQSLDLTIQPAIDVQTAIRKATGSLELYLLLGNQNDKNTFLDRMNFTEQRAANLGTSIQTDEQRADFVSLQSSLNNIENISATLINHYDTNPSGFSATNHTALLNALEQQTTTARIAAGNIATLEALKINKTLLGRKR